MSNNPIYIFYGDDIYRAKKQLENWKQAFSKKYEKGNIEIFENSEKPLLLSEITKQRDLFSTIKLCIIINPFNFGKNVGILDSDDFLKYIKNENSELTTIILWQKSDFDKRITVSKTILNGKNKNIKLYDFFLPTGTEALKFLASEFKKEGFKLNKDAGELLLKNFSDSGGKLNTWGASLAVEQLASFAFGRDTITFNDVISVIPTEISEDLFLPLLRDFSARDKRNFYKHLEGLLKNFDSEQEFLGLLSTIFEQVKNMILVLELENEGKSLGEIDKILDFKPGRSRYLQMDAKKFNIEDLIELSEKILVLEKDLKSSNVPAGIKLATFM